MNNKVRKEVTYFEIKNENVDQRLDNFLLTKLKKITRPEVYKLIRTGQVRVNSGRIKPSYRLQLGDKVRIPPFSLSTEKSKTPKQGVLDLIESRIAYENDSFIVLNKPSGFAVHGGSGIQFGVIEAIRHLRPHAPFLELVHRLDRETSGCLLIAKTRKSLLHLHKLLREETLTKIYYALVVGKWRGPKKVVMPLNKNQLKSGERVVKVDSEGKEASTKFKILRQFEDCTLLEAMPITGRTHQIRVHAAFMGHPIIGDDKYGDKKINKEFSQRGIQRLFLHAYSITIPQLEGKSETYICELDATLQNILEQLG
ncbi:MAG TPA: RluA family pseudouridine synthase [Gammaproteobacteria bacterium]|nr:RluA family pseudouridine synthase [Gammaproteobacteria bacterium]